MSHASAKPSFTTGWREHIRRLRQHLPFGLLAVALMTFTATAVWSFSPTANSSTHPVPVDQRGAWFPLVSPRSLEGIAAAPQSPLLQVNRSGQGDYLHDLSHLGTPQLVSGYAPQSATPMSDYYVIPVLDAQGNSVGAVVMLLDAHHLSGQVQSIDTYAQPRPNGTIAKMPLAHSLSVFTTQTRLSVQGYAQPRLVYFPFNFQAAAHGTLTWNGGGGFPDDPIWLFPGTNGHDYLVGTNGQVYQPNQLPTAQN